jgi:hypothetical protein
MKLSTKLAILCTSVAFLAVGTADLSNAQYKRSQECIDPQDCPSDQIERSEEGEKEYSGKRRRKPEQGENDGSLTKQDELQKGDTEANEQSRRKRKVEEEVSKPGDEFPDEQQYRRRSTAQKESQWKYDPKRHERRRKRDDRFLYEWNGYWYSEPYWWYDFDYWRPYRVSCGEGRLILLDRGFRRVRPIRCQGRTFIYLARRYGETFRITMQSRTGRILSIRPV